MFGWGDVRRQIEDMLLRNPGVCTSPSWKLMARRLHALSDFYVLMVMVNILVYVSSQLNTYTLAAHEIYVQTTCETSCWYSLILYIHPFLMSRTHQARGIVTLHLRSTYKFLSHCLWFICYLSECVWYIRAVGDDIVCGIIYQLAMCASDMHTATMSGFEPVS